MISPSYRTLPFRNLDPTHSVWLNLEVTFLIDSEGEIVVKEIWTEALRPYRISDLNKPEFERMVKRHSILS